MRNLSASALRSHQRSLELDLAAKARAGGSDRECGPAWVSGIFKLPPAEAICFRVVRPCRCPCVRPCVRPSVIHVVLLCFPDVSSIFLYVLTDFRQTFVTGASWDTDDLITFLGQKVKVQGHTMAAEAHSTRRYRRVQLFLVSVSEQRLLWASWSQQKNGSLKKLSNKRYNN